MKWIDSNFQLPCHIDFVEHKYPHRYNMRLHLYSNIAHKGFFNYIGLHYPVANVIIECKNYTGDPVNPELDQLAGRFSPSRGVFGIFKFDC